MVFVWIMKGRWRKLDLEYVTQVLNLLFLAMTEEDQDPNNVSYALMAANLMEHEIPEVVVYHILRLHSSSYTTEDNGMNSELIPDTFFVICPEKICRAYGHCILFGIVRFILTKGGRNAT